MKPRKIIGFILLLLLAFLIIAPTCWAKSKGYLYVVGYSFSQKKAYFSKIITQNVRNVSYSEEEYITEVELIQKMESQFRDYLASSMQLNTTNYTIAVRGAYKNENIAKEKMDKELNGYVKTGYTATIVRAFEYSN